MLKKTLYLSNSVDERLGEPWGLLQLPLLGLHEHLAVRVDVRVILLMDPEIGDQLPVQEVCQVLLKVVPRRLGTHPEGTSTAEAPEDENHVNNLID